MSRARIEAFATRENLYEAVVQAICVLIDNTLRDSDAFRISLAGGSTPQRLYELLSERELPWNQIHLFCGDERNVSIDHPDSNAGMVSRALTDRVDIPTSNVHWVPVKAGQPKAVADRYEQTLREQFGNVRFPRWDLVLLGMGDDGHTASLFPATAALDEHERWFVENWVEKFADYRYTLTVPAINSAAETWFVVAGEAKRDAYCRISSGAADPRRFPAQLITPTRWFLTGDVLTPQS